jgi:SOS-response transcriptional repressor LexA
MNKYQRAIQSLKDTGTYTMKVFGNSRTPLIKSGSTLTYRPFSEYEVGDIVFCKVKGRFIDAHLITKKDKHGESFRYMISNNHGWENGWTRQIYAKVVKIE